MSDRDAKAMIGGVTLLERAMDYSLGSLSLVSDVVLDRPTPCAGWTVHDLLIHMNESLAALCEAADTGWIDLVPDPDLRGATSLAATLRARACRLLGAWSNPGRPHLIAVGDRPLPSAIVACAGAIEVAVHGWDLAVGCGRHYPMPVSLAEELFDVARLMVTEADRPGRFARRVTIEPSAAPTERLLAFLGRDPAMSVV